jgi:NAD(P)-dependent dehydrogenase (short-subunit alcohol dehydrogenase family)
MDLNLSGKVAVVTGASKGIGLAITRSLVAEGVSVAAGARDGSDELSELASRSAVHPVLVDLTTPDGPTRLVEEAVRTFGGLDILVNNVGAVLPDPAVIDYSAAKGALTNFCKSLSKEFGPRGVRVNTISPGPVETNLWLGDDGVAATVARVQGGHPEEVAKQAVADTSTGRFTHPQEVADLVRLLASDRAGNVTGTDVLIDGGLVKTL